MSAPSTRRRPLSTWTTSTCSDTEDPEWDAFVENCDSGHYATIKARAGWSAIRVKVRDEDRILAGAQVLVRSWRGAGGIAYVPKGPLLDALRRFAAARRVRYMAVQPPMNTYGLERAR